MDQKILQYCFEKGLLLEENLLEIFNETNSLNSVKLIIKKIHESTNQKLITKEVINNNKDYLVGLVENLSSQEQKDFERLRVKLGLSIEISKAEINTKKKIISKEKSDKMFISDEKEPFKETFLEEVEILPSVNFPPSLKITNKKLEVSDFSKYFRGRFFQMKKLLEEHKSLENLTSINKMSGKKQSISLIGIVSKKRTTKNKNIVFEVEDLTGKINVLINKSKIEIYEKAEDVALDSVIGFKGSGDKEIFFANDIIFPDSILPHRKKSSFDESVAFIGDLHFGSKRFLGKGFEKFIDYLNGKFPEDLDYKKIKYLFIVGDIVTGVGNYPNQEIDLEIDNIEEQFSCLAELLGKIRKDIKIIISPGNHDGVRLMEPQPVFDKKFAWRLYEMENVIITENPSEINIGARGCFLGFNVLTYHGFSFPFYANNVPKLMLQRAMNQPEEIMKYLLKNRHLAPTHTSVQYFPHEEDVHVIKNIPDIFVSAHTHKSGVSYYNNILLISTSCWEAMTPYQEKFGNTPDHCKVPVFNLKTRAVKILNFEEKENLVEPKSKL